MGGTEGTLALICYYYLEASVPCALFLGVCHFDWGLSYMGSIFGICHYGWGLSNMGGFCHGFCQGTDGLICYYTYTFRALCPPSFGVCHLDWVLSHMGWIFGICRYGWGLSNMGGFCRSFCQSGFVKYGRQDLSIMGGTEGTLAFI